MSNRQKMPVMQVENLNREMKSHIHYEDMAMKVAAQFFGDELLPYLGVTQKVKAIMPTEVIHLEARQMYQDFNYLMEDGSLGHFEFESDAIREEDLRRFREYEACTSRIYQMPVVTYVLCSAKEKKIRQELREGINTYRVKVVRLKDQNADEFFARIEKMKTIHREEYVGMVLTPLMSGEMPQKERILRSIRLLKEQEDELTAEEVSRIHSMLYAFANKFLSGEDLENVKEVLRMTKLGEMIFNDGVEEGMKIGMEEGIEKGIQSLIRTCINVKVPRDEILKNLMEEYSLGMEKAEKYMEMYWNEG